MSDQATQTVTQPVLITAAPELFVADIKASCDFFVGKLGFKTVFVYGEPPFYGQVMRDGARINLRCVDTPVLERARVVREELLSADMAEEIKRLYLDFQAAGVTFHQPLKRQPWGAKNFIVEDPDGNLLLFA